MQLKQAVAGKAFFFSTSIQRHFVLRLEVQSTFLPIIWSVRPGFLYKSVCISSSFSESLARGTVPKGGPGGLHLDPSAVHAILPIASIPGGRHYNHFFPSEELLPTEIKEERF